MQVPTSNHYVTRRGGYVGYAGARGYRAGVIYPVLSRVTRPLRGTPTEPRGAPVWGPHAEQTPSEVVVVLELKKGFYFII